MNITVNELRDLLARDTDGGARVSELEAERAALTAECERLHGQVTEQVDTIMQADREAETLRERAQTLQAALCTANESVRRLEAGAREYEEEMKRLQTAWEIERSHMQADWRGDRERMDAEVKRLEREAKYWEASNTRLRCDSDVANAQRGTVDPETARLAELGRLVEAMPLHTGIEHRDTISLYPWEVRDIHGRWHAHKTPTDALRAAGIGGVDAGTGPGPG